MMDKETLASVARTLVSRGRGILAADESTGTIRKRLNGVGVESTEENRRFYRELLFSTRDFGRYISGVILFDETIRQSSEAGKPFPQMLSESGAIPGIKVDRGAKPMAMFPNERITEGLDGLRDRLLEYRELGAQFAKWRAVITIGERIPTMTCINSNAEALARYAALCQEAGLVPIVEPEVLMDGDHTILRSQAVTEITLHNVFSVLNSHRIYLEGMLLKPNMVVSGYEHPDPAGVEEVAERTLETLRRTVPAAVPGIVFLSGGQSPEQATAHLNAMNQMGPHPWALSFSFGRALQEPSLDAWRGVVDNKPAAQDLFLHRAHMNSLATIGEWSSDKEKASA